MQQLGLTLNGGIVDHFSASKESMQRLEEWQRGAYLVGEELAVVLGGEIGLSGLGGVELEALADALAQDVQRRVGLHDLGHRLDDQRLDALKPVAKRAVQVVRQVDGNHHPCTSAHPCLVLELCMIEVQYFAA